MLRNPNEDFLKKTIDRYQAKQKDFILNIAVIAVELPTVIQKKIYQQINDALGEDPHGCIEFLITHNAYADNSPQFKAIVLLQKLKEEGPVAKEQKTAEKDKSKQVGSKGDIKTILSGLAKSFQDTKDETTKGRIFAALHEYEKSDGFHEPHLTDIKKIISEPLFKEYQAKHKQQVQVTATEAYQAFVERPGNLPGSLGKVAKELPVSQLVQNAKMATQVSSSAVKVPMQDSSGKSADFSSVVQPANPSIPVQRPQKAVEPPKVYTTGVQSVKFAASTNKSKNPTEDELFDLFSLVPASAPAKKTLGS